MSAKKTIRIADRYRLVRELGRGAAGVVYLGFDERLDRKVAVKLLHPSKQSSAQQHSDDEKRFIHEARAAAKLHHPGLCGVFDFGRHGNRLFLVMNFIDGVPLTSLTENPPRNRNGFMKTVAIVSSVAQAMNVAHEAKVIHYDLKPENIVLRKDDGQPVVMDFGLAGATKTHQPNQSNVASGIFGSPAYMSPEQAGGDITRLGAHCDLYALGATFYELLTGRLPIDGNLNQLLTHLRDPDHHPKPAMELNPELPQVISGLCQQMLSKTIEHRPDSMAKVAETLDSWLNAQTQKIAASETVTAAPISQAVTSESTGTKSVLVQPRSSSRRDQKKRLGLVYSFVAMGALAIPFLLLWPIRSDSTAVVETNMESNQSEVTKLPSADSVAASTEAISEPIVERSTAEEVALSESKDPSTSSPKAATPLSPWLNPIRVFPPDPEMGAKAVWKFANLIEQSDPRPQKFYPDERSQTIDLDDWRIVPHESIAQWKVDGDSISAKVSSNTVTSLIYPLPIDQFDLSLEAKCTANERLDITLKNHPGNSGRVRERLSIGLGQQRQIHWVIASSGSKLEVPLDIKVTDDSWVPIKVGSNGKTLSVQIGNQELAFDRPDGKSIDGFVGFRNEKNLAVHIRRFQFNDRTQQRDPLWRKFPAAVFEGEQSFFDAPQIDFWRYRISVVQQFGGRNPKRETVNRGCIWEVPTGGLLQNVRTNTAGLHRIVGPGVLCQPAGIQPFSLITLRWRFMRGLRQGTSELTDVRSTFAGSADMIASWNPHERWAIFRNWRPGSDIKFYLVGVTPSGRLMGLSQSSSVSNDFTNASFASDGVKWLLTGGQQAQLQSAEGVTLGKRTLNSNITAQAISNDGTHAVVATDDRRWFVFDLTKPAQWQGKIKKELPANVESIRISPNDAMVLMRYANSTSELFRLEDGESLRRWGNTPFQSVFTTDSRSLIMPFKEPTILKVWHLGAD